MALALVVARPHFLFERYWPLWLPVHAFYDPTAKTQGGHPMLEVHNSTNQFEVHDPAILAQAKAVLDACSSPQEMQEAVLAAVSRNEEWRGKRCLNLLAPEAPTSPTVRALLSAEVGTRAAEGHIGPLNRWAGRGPDAEQRRGAGDRRTGAGARGGGRAGLAARSVPRRGVRGGRDRRPA